jgi:hypothetical protein
MREQVQEKSHNSRLFKLPMQQIEPIERVETSMQRQPALFAGWGLAGLGSVIGRLLPVTHAWH